MLSVLQLCTVPVVWTCWHFDVVIVHCPLCYHSEWVSNIMYTTNITNGTHILFY